jgi:hypothetical protein
MGDAKQQPPLQEAAAAKNNDAAAAPNFVTAMRKATRSQHNVSNVLILAKLAVALTDPRLYAKALAQFLPVYAALEAALERHASDPSLAEARQTLSGAGARAAAIERDLEHWLGSEWRTIVAAETSAAAAAYAGHLAALADGPEPALLLPYVWSLHVPVLLPFMRRRIAAGLGVPDGEDGASPGLEFFSVRLCCVFWRRVAFFVALLLAAADEANNSITPTFSLSDLRPGAPPGRAARRRQPRGRAACAADARRVLERGCRAVSPQQRGRARVQTAAAGCGLGSGAARGDICVVGCCDGGVGVARVVVAVRRG